MGLGLIAGTILAHVAGIRLLLTLLDRWLTGEGRLRPSLGRVMVFASLALAVLHHVEAALWAAVYIGLGVLADWDTAVYFSIVTMTSVGYGDVTFIGRLAPAGRVSGDERHAAVRDQHRLPVRCPAAILEVGTREGSVRFRVKP